MAVEFTPRSTHPGIGQRVHGAPLLAAVALVATGAAATLSPALARLRDPPPQRPSWAEVERVPVEPPGLSDDGDDQEDSAASRGQRRTCINVDRIRSAVALDERIIELKLRGGQTLHMRFAEDCPFIAFYDGFYYHSDLGGRLCARRDSVLARSGGACTIESIMRAPR